MSQHNRLITTGVAPAITMPRPALKGTAAVEQMADDLRVINTRTGGVTADDLTLAGWTREQIERHVADARETATRLSTVAA